MFPNQSRIIILLTTLNLLFCMNQILIIELGLSRVEIKFFWKGYFSQYNLHKPYL